jgi:Spy/CpxP family protein refolding chaperone
MELNIAMMRNGVNAAHMASVIKKSRFTYDKKRFGDVWFTPGEILLVADELSLDASQIDQIFFDGRLSKRKNSENIA